MKRNIDLRESYPRGYKNYGYKSARIRSMYSTRLEHSLSTISGSHGLAVWGPSKNNKTNQEKDIRVVTPLFAAQQVFIVTQYLRGTPHMCFSLLENFGIRHASNSWSIKTGVHISKDQSFHHISSDGRELLRQPIVKVTATHVRFKSLTQSPSAVLWPKVVSQRKSVSAQSYKRISSWGFSWNQTLSFPPAHFRYSLCMLPCLRHRF